MLSLTHRILDGFSRRDSSGPLPPTIPQLLIFTTFPRLGNTQAAFEVVEDPHPLCPWCEDDVAEAKVFAEEVWTFGVSVGNPCLDSPKQFRACFIEWVWALVRVLQEPVMVLAWNEIVGRLCTCL